MSWGSDGFGLFVGHSLSGKRWGNIGEIWGNMGKKCKNMWKEEMRKYAGDGL
jgi:hypothetical protein